MTSRTAMVYLGLVVALSLPFWLLGIASPNGLLPFGLPLSALMTVCPMLAALILTVHRGGSRQAWALCGRAFDVRRITNRAWLLPAALTMPMVAVSSWVVMSVLDYQLPEPSISWILLPGMLVIYFAGAIGEELGWMGYLVDPLQERMGAFAASLVIGVAWQAWHVVPFYAMGRSWRWIAAQFLAGILMRILIVRMYNSSGGSVFLTVLFHASINVSYSLFPNQGSHYDPVITSLVLALVVMAAVRSAGTPSRGLIRGTAGPGR